MAKNQFLNWGKLPKMQFDKKIDLFDFTSFFAWPFLIFWPAVKHLKSRLINKPIFGFKKCQPSSHEWSSNELWTLQVLFFSSPFLMIFQRRSKLKVILLNFEKSSKIEQNWWYSKSFLRFSQISIKSTIQLLKDLKTGLILAAVWAMFS